ncbi:MAG: ankyrin repeat protein 26-like [Gammaproteobacteria bacterium]|jgi:ankyrin repeat protein|nr:ankyrin repeat protein 26-like [Gammaproteobacteria bacterium]
MPSTLRDIFKEPSHFSFLKRRGYDLDRQIDQPHPQKGYFLIQDAASCGQKEMIAILLQEGVDINFSVSQESDEFRGQTPLCIALSQKNNITASFLIEKKADVAKCDLEGEFALIKAVHLGDSEKIIRDLIAAGANVHQENLINPHAYPAHLPFKHRTALMYALASSSVNAAKLLLDYGAAIVNSQGQNVLDYCMNDPLRQVMKKEIEQRCLSIQKQYQILRDATSFPGEIAETVCSYLPHYPCANSFFKPSRKKMSRYLSNITEPASPKEGELSKKRKINAL